ncbi:MAG: diguanylate cyclase, partial [Desulfurellaceae bacterium]|nr:diguanylate cyclase [Desulfurellaceae bacterium]
EALQKSEARLKEAEKLALLGYWELDLQKNVLYWSDEIYRIFEIDPSRFEASYEAFLNTVHPDDRELVNRAYTESAKNRTPYSIDHRILLKDGRIKFVHERCETYYDEQSNAVRSLGTAQDITERKKAEERIKYLGFHDSLTGLYNRAYFEEEMKRLNTQRKYPLTIVMADINGLKVINDTLGHNKGDKLLKDTAKLLKSIAREGDIIARIGGDEFAVILPHSDENVVQAFCNRFRDACKRYNRKTQLKLSIALGYAIQSGQYKDMEKVLEQADENMYTEKLSDIASREKHIIDTLKTILAVRDPHTGEHAERLQDLAEALGKDIGLSGFELKRLRLLALLHDIGKIGTPDNVLFKPDKLTEEEWEVMKKHSEDGYKMAGNIPQLYGIAEAILYHHERWNGTGYPKGLKGKEIPILSRIISIVDAYDVVLTERPYKKAMTEEEAIQELKENAGTQFDPELVERFLKIKVNKE